MIYVVVVVIIKWVVGVSYIVGNSAEIFFLPLWTWFKYHISSIFKVSFILEFVKELIMVFPYKSKSFLEYNIWVVAITMVFFFKKERKRETWRNRNFSK